MILRISDSFALFPWIWSLHVTIDHALLYKIHLITGIVLTFWWKANVILVLSYYRHATLNPRASEHQERRHDNVHVSSFPFFQFYSRKMEMTTSLLHLEIKLYCSSCILLNLSHFTMYFVCHGFMMVTLVEFMSN